MKYLLIPAMFALVSLVGCTDDGSVAKTKEKETTTVFDTQLNALDNTRNIENVLQDSADERQKTLDGE